MSLQLQTGVLQGYNTFLDSAPVANPYFAQYYMKVRNLFGFFILLFIISMDNVGCSSISRECGSSVGRALNFW